MKADLSVLMSVYEKEKPEYLKECFESLLAQTVQAKEWIIVKDGILPESLEAVINEYQKKYMDLITTIQLNVNVGLGLALREGVTQCTYELIARMDTDDIARSDRFEKQLEKFFLNPNLDICGSNILEFEDNINNIVSKRNVPSDQVGIEKFQRKRSAFNHMTVMFKRNAVIKAGNYEHCPLMEDDMLWVKMILNHSNMANLPEALVYARVGKDMLNRRGGYEYFKKYKLARKKIYKTGFINYREYIQTLLYQFAIACSPLWIRKFIFLNFLRGGD